MKKIISIICVLLFVFSLTSCSNDKSNSKNDKKDNQQTSVTENSTVKAPTVNKFINEKALNNTDNLTFCLESVNENELLLVNVNYPNLINDIGMGDSGMTTSKIKINDVFSYTVEVGGFRFAFISDGYQTWQSYENDYDRAIVSQDNNIMLISRKHKYRTDIPLKYDFWVKANNEYIHLNVTDINKPNAVLTESQAMAAYNLAKEHFTFATVTTETKKQNSILFDVPDLNSVKLIGQEETTSLVNDWVFVNDIILKGYEKNGVNFITSNNLHIEVTNLTHYYSNLPYKIELSDNDRELGLTHNEYFAIQILPIKEGSSYEMGATVKEFNIGSMKVKIEGIDPSNKNYILFKIKTQTGAEFQGNICFKSRAFEEDYEYIRYYLEKVFSSNK